MKSRFRLWISYISIVTPLAGVWIEIRFINSSAHCLIVTPLAGVWIEIDIWKTDTVEGFVTPLAGVWIEIDVYEKTIDDIISHSPRGSVD